MSGSPISRGFVIKIKGADYFVTDGVREIRCSVRGRFRIGKSPEETLPVVGDDVEYRLLKGSGGRPLGQIVSVRPRRSIFARADSSGKRKLRIFGANIDHVIIVLSVREPALNLRLLDRMLVSAESDRIDPVICINKMDLADDPPAIKRMLEPYRKIPYRVIFSSTVDGTGMKEIEEAMSAKRSIMAGPSGSGKTSILSILEPELDMRTASVSDKTGKGKHTTTHFEFHPLSGGGYLGDTPGIREFGIWGQSKQTLDGCFPDFDPFFEECRFSSCTHSHEPGCGVKRAVEKGKISPARYDSYLRIMEDLPDRLD